MDVKTLPPTASVEECLSVVSRDGCVIIRELAGRDTMDLVRGELDPYFERTPFCDGCFVGYTTKRMGGLMLKSPTSRDLVLNRTVLGVMEALLLPNCSRMQLNLTQAIQIWPGEVAQVFHRDDELFPYADKRCEFMVNAHWAYDDFTPDNGATRIVPGSHLRPLTRTPDPSEIAYAAMPRGSVLIYLGSAVHSGGANRSNRPRTAVTLSYSLGWLRQAENHYLTMPPSVAREFPETLRQLVGYAIHAPNLGWYEGQDPAVVLQPSVPETLAARDYMPPEVVDMLRQHRESLLAAAE
jgi:ectoine hydroxylase-related dioxygenase (phytanoyl-CoA dioxygenase family)